MTDPFDIVIFGGTGDLAQRKLIPALYRAFREQQLHVKTRIVCCGRSQTDIDNYLDTTALALQQHLAAEEFSVEAWDQFKNYLFPTVLDVSLVNSRWQALKDVMDTDVDKNPRILLGNAASDFWS